MKFKEIAVFSITVCCIFLANGCVESLANRLATGLVSSSGFGAADTIVSPALESIGENKSQNHKPIEEHKIGKNIVVIHAATIKHNSGYIFIACDKKKQVLGSLFYHATNEEDMKKYNTFLSMNTEKKRIYIHATFKKFGLDLGPVESDAPILLATYTPQEGDTFAKVVENLGPADDEFLLKNEKKSILDTDVDLSAELDDTKGAPHTTLAWWFDVKNDQLTRVVAIHIMDGVVCKVEERTSDKPPGTTGFYFAYKVACATMAYRPHTPKFTLVALDNQSPPNIN